MNSRRLQFHGITSIGLVLTAVVIAAVALFRTSWALGVVYLVICGAALAGIMYAFCAKCPCQTRCGHVFPGKMAAALTNRQPGPYTTTEIAVVALALLLLFGFPQPWLWRHLGLFVTFWVLTVIAMVQIRTVVCRACDNVHCPAHVRT